MRYNPYDTVFSNKPDFIFVFQSKLYGEKQIKLIMMQNGFIYPVFLDIDDKIFALNNFLKNDAYQCFLLDKENKVIAIGNPAHNPTVWKLYCKIINEGNNK